MAPFLEGGKPVEMTEDDLVFDVVVKAGLFLRGDQVKKGDPRTRPVRADFRVQGHGRGLGVRRCRLFARVQGNMPHAEKRRYAHTAADENAVALSRQEAVAEMTVGAVDRDLVARFEQVQRAGVVAGLLDAQFEARCQVVAAGDGVGVRFGGYPRLVHHQVDKLAGPERHLLCDRSKGDLQHILDSLDFRDPVRIARADETIQEADGQETAQGQRQQSVQPVPEQRIGGNVPVDHDNMHDEQQEKGAGPLMRSLPAVVRDFHPQGRDEQEDQEQQRANTEIVPKEVAVPLRSDEPEPVQERGQVGQPVQGEKERMQEDQPEGGFAEPFMHLVDLVQAVKISFQQPVARRQDHAPAEQDGCRERGGLCRILERIVEPVIERPLAAQPEDQGEGDSQDNRLQVL